MKNLLKFTAVLLIVAGTFACTDKEQEAESAPVEFTEYSLAGTGCQWTNLGYDGKVITVNSKEDLKKYITGTEENLPYVDFSKHTLLLASDSDNDVRNIDAAFFKNAANQYTVKVSIRYGDAAVMTNWALAILTSKIPDGSILALEKEEDKSVPVEFTEYSLAGTACQWTNLSYDGKVIIINSKEELKKYITCEEDDFPDVDFSKHTLLLANGPSTNGIGKIETVLLKNTSKKYILKVTVHMGITMVAQGWCISIITPKISDKSEIKLNVELTYY
jgi:WD40 repeat protein